MVKELVRCQDCRIEFISGPKKTFLFQHRHRCPQCRKRIILPGKVPSPFWPVVGGAALISLGAVRGDLSAVLGGLIFAPPVTGLFWFGTKASDKNELMYRDVMSKPDFNRYERGKK